MSTPNLVMRPEEFRLLKEFVQECYGLVLEEGKARYLALKLFPRLEELRVATFSDYYAYLKFAPRASQERQRFISLITNNETYFFREEAQLNVLSGQILPRLKEEKLARGERSIRIVSAGCSSGEEVYTLAMLLLESGCFAWDWEIRVTGIDVDPKVLERAERGAYPPNSFRGATPPYLERYLRAAGEETVVRDTLKKHTRFLEGNLLDPGSVLSAQEPDIIFCRNVLIYFSEETTRRVINNFSRASSPGGRLFLGHAESLSRIATDFLPQRYPGAIVYQKRD